MPFHVTIWRTSAYILNAYPMRDSSKPALEILTPFFFPPMRDTPSFFHPSPIVAFYGEVFESQYVQLVETHNMYLERGKTLCKSKLNSPRFVGHTIQPDLECSWLSGFIAYGHRHSTYWSFENLGSCSGFDDVLFTLNFFATSHGRQPLGVKSPHLFSFRDTNGGGLIAKMEFVKKLPLVRASHTFPTYTLKLTEEEEENSNRWRKASPFHQLSRLFIGYLQWETSILLNMSAPIATFVTSHQLQLPFLSASKPSSHDMIRARARPSHATSRACLHHESRLSAPLAEPIPNLRAEPIPNLQAEPVPAPPAEPPSLFGSFHPIFVRTSLLGKHTCLAVRTRRVNLQHDAIDDMVTLWPDIVMTRTVMTVRRDSTGSSHPDCPRCSPGTPKTRFSFLRERTLHRSRQGQRQAGERPEVTVASHRDFCFRLYLFLTNTTYEELLIEHVDKAKMIHMEGFLIKDLVISTCLILVRALIKIQEKR
uniref:Uncharacterized protein n=1 Tax=Cucumis melo TaxID=3656 RepID=A0A9I9EIP6_CUCME